MKKACVSVRALVATLVVWTLAELPGMAVCVFADDLKTAADWPRFLNVDFSGTAKLANPTGGSVTHWDWSNEPSCRWSLSVGDGYGLGVIQDGAYFHFDADAGEERLRKIDMTTGEVLWSQTSDLSYRDLYGYESGARCSPTIEQDQIFTHGVAGMVTARDRDSGEAQWRVDTNDRYHVVQNFFGAGSAPLIVDGAVLVMVGGSPIADQSIAPGRLDRVSPDGSLLVAFDRHTGEELWKSGDDLASYSSPRTMRIDGKEYVLVLGREFLHVIDPVDGRSSGRIRFRADILESVNAMVPVVDGQRVLVSDCYQLGATLFEIEHDQTGLEFTPIWQDPDRRRRDQSLRSHMSTPVLHEGFLYACSGRNAPDSDFRCVDFLTGEVQWTAMQRRRSSATRLSDVLLVQTERGTLHIVRCDPEQFDEIAVWELNEPSSEEGSSRPAIRFPCWSAPVVSGNSVLVRGDKTVLCLELPRSEQTTK
ncbi:outer membrane protein assembly factor BamB family protein [Rhodopirellula sallentina]|uniref:Pyrrolo-quinoline quinone n=1 Tax=Rhodopirellula sallentina SM41 TaxID=1263870 RepID=M5UAN1_9BACT|nr:PQQ-binding-like beta-propeller repeat protein [Rhodopirellula sallentina]EMI58492.1 Pyrrolo-quinoline quinone [Rhodopirellula sallentina SM41]